MHVVRNLIGEDRRTGRGRRVVGDEKLSATVTGQTHQMHAIARAVKF